MALHAETVYFPTLDKCLTGEERLISWKTAYTALCDFDEARNNTALEAFLTDPVSQTFLKSALNPFPTPNEKSRAEFDTKIAPINVSESTDGQYSLVEVKDDVLWLSKELNITELVALRIVILEWQQRAEDYLLSHHNEADGYRVIATETNESRLDNQSAPSGRCRSRANLDETRSRQLNIFLEERCAILRTTVVLVGLQSASTLTQTSRGPWIDDLAQTVSSSFCSTKENVAREKFMEACIGFVSQRLRALDDPTQRPAVFAGDDLKQIAFSMYAFLDIISGLRTLLFSVYLRQTILESTIIRSWYKLVADYDFFQNIQPSPALEDPSILQCLVSNISLAFLQLPLNVDRLQDSAVSALENPLYPILPETSWLSEDKCVKEVNLTLCHAAQRGVSLAGPAMYAWGLLTSIVRDTTKMQQEIREQSRRDSISAGNDSTRNRRYSGRDLRQAQVFFETRFTILQDFDLDSEARDDPPAYIVRSAVDRLNVYSTISALSFTVTNAYRSEADMPVCLIARMTLLDLTRLAMPFVAYGAEVLEAILTVISPDIPCSDRTVKRLLAAQFASDNAIFRRHIIDQVIARYPFELSPFLQIFKLLLEAPSNDISGPVDVVRELETTPTMTLRMDEKFNAYALDHEDENTNSIILTRPLKVFASKSAHSFYASQLNSIRAIEDGSNQDNECNVLLIPSGTSGVVVRESRPMVFKLDHDHSALEYLGLLLLTALPTSDLIIHPTSEKLDYEVAAEIVSLLTALLKSSLRQDQGIEEAHFVLGRFGFALPGGQDIIIVTFDIFESVLLSYLAQSTQDGCLELLVACAEFFDVLTMISPERVWTGLANSSLLALSGVANALVSVVSASEIPAGQYHFLTACTKIYSHLLDDAVTSTARRRDNVRRKASRFDSPVVSTETTPERTMIKVLGAFQTVLLDVWHAIPNWPFASLSQKCEITTMVVDAFHTLLLNTYGVGKSRSAGGGLSSALVPSANHLVNALAPSDGLNIALDQFGAILGDGLMVADGLLPVHERASVMQQTEVLLAFLITFVRVLRQEGPSKRASQSALQLLNGMPTLSSLLAADYSFKRMVSDLVAEIVKALNDGETSEPRSLLGQMSSRLAKPFLSVVSQLDRPMKDVQTESSMWNMLSSIMSNKQHWFASYILTGALPRQRLADQELQVSVTNNKSLLMYALDQLSEDMAMAPERSIAMLNLIASAQNAWIWASVAVRSHPNFIQKALDWTTELQGRAPNSSQELILAYEHEMAAVLCDILAVNLHSSLEAKHKSLLKLIVPNLTFFREHAVQVDTYNRSLHKRLAENFSKRFPHCELADFERTPANPMSLGRDYVYDLHYATRLLQHDPAWLGGQSSRNQGFIDEFVRANINLSLVAAQTKLLRSWNVLATTLSESAEHLHPLRVQLAATALKCLDANAEANFDQPGMDKVVRTRADMAFVLISSLVAARAAVPTMKELLPAAWSLIRTSPSDFEVATSVEDVEYYRLLLKIVYLAIQPHIYIEPTSTESNGQDDRDSLVKVNALDNTTSACLIEIVSKVIAPSFRALCGNLHTNALLALPGDFALLTGLLKAVLSVRGISALQTQIADIVVSTSVVRGALSLFSWADKLAEAMDNDPIYGELAIKFLLELSTVQPIAEQLALDGILAQLSSANLTNYFRKPGGKGPFDEPHRMFSIWTEGFLPLCLNLLDAVGPPIAAEVATFLNSFAAQLGRAQTALENREPTPQRPYLGALTLSLASEAHSLCLIGLILSSDTARGAAEGIDAAEVPRLELDHDKLKEDAAALARLKTNLAARIVPLGDVEAKWQHRDVRGAGGNMLQEKFLREITALSACFDDTPKPGSPGVAFAL